jgi:NitT/TauT family transport system substrate-binding protein
MHSQRLLAVAAVGLSMVGLAGCGGNSDASSGSGELVIGTQDVADHTILYTAIDQGMMKKSVDAKIGTVNVKGLGPAQSALASNSINLVTMGPSSIALANESGLDLKYVCGSISGNVLKMVALAGSKVSTVASAGSAEKAVAGWKGLTIGVPALQGAIFLRMPEILKIGGLTKDDVKFVAVGVGQPAVTALEQKQVDVLAAVFFTPELLAEKGVVAFDTATEIPQQYGSAWVAKASWLKDHADVASNFCHALSEAGKFVADPANSKAVEKVISEHFGLTDPASLKVASDPEGSLSIVSTEIDCAAVDRALQVAASSGVIKTDPTVDCASLLWDKAPTTK